VACLFIYLFENSIFFDEIKNAIDLKNRILLISI